MSAADPPTASVAGDDARSGGSSACPFLVPAGGGGDRAGVDRCLAGDRPVALTALQVTLVCRAELQGECPRFVGAVRRGRRAPAPPRSSPAEAALGRPAPTAAEISPAGAAEPGVSEAAGFGGAPAATEPVDGSSTAAAETTETGGFGGPIDRSGPLRASAGPMGGLVVGLGATLAGVPRARVLALAVLALAVLVAAAGSLRPGGLLIAGLGSPTPTERPAPSPTPGPTPSTLPSVGPSPSPSPTLAPSPTLRPSIEASPSPLPASPSPSPSPSPTSDRYALLEPCPDRPDCYIYTVRPGDNLWSIGNYFGVPLATIYELNPWARTTGLRAGQKLVLPPPTR
jgi:hypothetical protein